MPDEVADLLREHCPELLNALLGDIAQEAFEHLLSRVQRLLVLRAPAFRFYVRALWASVSQRQGSGERRLTAGVVSSSDASEGRQTTDRPEGAHFGPPSQAQGQAQSQAQRTSPSETRSDFVGSPSSGIRAGQRSAASHAYPEGTRV